MENNISLIEAEKKKIAFNEGEEIYYFNCSFTDKSDKPITVVMIEKEEIPSFYSMIKKIISHRSNFYITFKFKTSEGVIRHLDETNKNIDGYISGIIYEHQSYVETLKKNQNAKEFNLDIDVTFNAQKRINLQIFASKFTDLHSFRVKTFFNQFIPKNNVRTPTYKFDYHNTYEKIVKEKEDLLIIFTDENFIEQVMDGEFEKADRIMFWCETHKAKELMAKNNVKIKACNNVIDFLLTPRFFQI